MGTAASALSDEDKAAIAVKMKDRLDKGNSDIESLFKDIKTEYTTALTNVQSKAEPVTKSVTKRPSLDKKPEGVGKRPSLDKKPVPEKKMQTSASAAGLPQKKKVTRRRSYDVHQSPAERNNNVIERKLSTVTDQADLIKLVTATCNAEQKEEAKETQPAQAEPEKAEPEKPKGDSWDSIVEQPFCNVCEMAFKTSTLLDKHVKYSSVHSLNLKAKEKKDEAVKGLLPNPKNNDEYGNQQEGIHYKLMYQGSKHYWKTDSMYDIHMFHHIVSDTLEVIVFDIRKHTEKNRIYLNYFKLAGNVEDVVQASLDEKMKAMTKNNKFAIPDSFDKEAYKRELLRDSITHFVIQRLRQEQPIGFGDKAQTESVAAIVDLKLGLEYASWEVDKFNPLLDTTPKAIRPVKVTRRRKSTDEEIQANIASIKQDLDKANDLSAYADKISQIISDTAEHMRATTKKWWQADHISVAARRWNWAYNKVLLLITKEKMEKLLEKYNVKWVKLEGGKTISDY